LCKPAATGPSSSPTPSPDRRRTGAGAVNSGTLKRIFNLARQNGKLNHVPHIPMLKERNVRTGFFEREQIARIVVYLPPAIRPAVPLACITGWRIPSEVLPLQWEDSRSDAPHLKDAKI
jgi:integrase